MKTEDLLLLRDLLEEALDDESMCSRRVPTLKGRSRQTYGSGLLHGLDAVRAELDARGSYSGIDSPPKVP